jgi:hypothetical protein
MKKYFCFLLMGLFWWHNTCNSNSVGHTVFCRTPVFQGSLKNKFSPWTTSLSVSFLYANASTSRNKSETRGPLLDLYGTLNLSKLGVDAETTGKTLTKKFWGASGSFIKDFTDKTLSISGNYSHQEILLNLQQFLFSGFFFTSNIIIRDAYIKNLSYFTKEATLGEESKESFIKITLPKILAEHDFNAGTSMPVGYRYHYIPEIILHAGWANITTKNLSYFDTIRSSIQAGVNIPVSDNYKLQNICNIPSLHEEFLGCSAKGQAEIGFWKALTAGCYTNIKTFFNKNKEVRLKTHESQEGPFNLEKAYTSINPGSMWDMCGYIKTEGLITGLNTIFGYSFSRHEKTSVRVKDENFLKPKIKEAPKNGTANDTTLISKDAIANNDKKLWGWTHQSIHFYLEYTPSLGRFSPFISLGYSHSLTGKQIFVADAIGGTLGLSFSWNI